MRKAMLFVSSDNKKLSLKIFFLISEAEHRSVKKGGIEVQEIEGTVSDYVVLTTNVMSWT